MNNKISYSNYLRFAVLALLVCAGTAVAPAEPSLAGAFDVRQFGAKGDGKTLDSPAINRAIEAAAKAGGGTVFFPAGTYLSGSIHLRSRITLYLDMGSTIFGAPDGMNAYDAAELNPNDKFQDFGHSHWHNSLIWGENLEQIAIVGQGTINGGGMGKGSGDVRVPDGNGNKSIALKLCRNVNLRDITMAHGGHFAILLTGCDNVSIENLKIDTNRDGMDIDCCRNVVVSNCRVNSPLDDGICPKSSFALGRPVITENLTIVNCQVSGFEEGTLLDGTMKPSRKRTGRIKFGTEANGGFRNCTVANCTFRCCQGLALEEVDGGILENITFNNISMMDVAQYPIYITLGVRNRGPGVTQTGKLRNILISNIIATGIEPMSGIQITGVPGEDIEGVRLENIRLIFNGGGTREDAARVPPELGKGYPSPTRIGVMPAYGVFARHVRNLELANIHLSFLNEDLRPAMVCVDVDGLEIDNFKAQVAPGVIPAKFEQVTRLVVRNSPVLQELNTGVANAAPHVGSPKDQH
jgi:hypothetical protein